jgi:oxygen-independent coproporphyrinogen III oxidase
LEANPGEASLEYLKDIKSLGINRISMGFQSLDDNTLKILGRLHDSKDCLETFQNVRKAGFDNINTDMIFNIPNLTVNNWKKDLNKLLELEPEHISAYSLTVEPSTQLFNLVKRKEIIMPIEDTDIEQFLVTEDILMQNGYNHYEVSNYSKKNKECLHNLHYWNLSPYLSFGPSAHSYDLHKRWWNIRSLEKYINNISSNKSPIDGSEKIKAKDHYNEMILNSLRLSKGIDLNLLKKSYVGDFNNYLNNIINKWDCLEIKNQSLQLSKNGMLFVDEISSDMFI